jgi:hypothetical protein
MKRDRRQRKDGRRNSRIGRPLVDSFQTKHVDIKNVDVVTMRMDETAVDEHLEGKWGTRSGRFFQKKELHNAFIASPSRSSLSLRRRNTGSRSA